MVLGDKKQSRAYLVCCVTHDNSSAGVPCPGYALFGSHFGSDDAIRVEVCKSHGRGYLYVGHGLAERLGIGCGVSRTHRQGVGVVQTLKDKPEDDTIFAGKPDDVCLFSIDGEAIPRINAFSGRRHTVYGGKFDGHVFEPNSSVWPGATSCRAHLQSSTSLWTILSIKLRTRLRTPSAPTTTSAVMERPSEVRTMTCSSLSSIDSTQADVRIDPRFFRRLDRIWRSFRRSTKMILYPRLRNTVNTPSVGAMYPDQEYPYLERYMLIVRDVASSLPLASNDIHVSKGSVCFSISSNSPS